MIHLTFVNTLGSGLLDWVVQTGGDFSLTPAKIFNTHSSAG